MAVIIIITRPHYTWCRLLSVRGQQIVLTATHEREYIISSWPPPRESWRPSTLTQRSNLLIKSRASSFTDQIRDGYIGVRPFSRSPQLGGRCNLCGPLPTAPLANACAARWQIFDISRRHVLCICERGAVLCGRSIPMLLCILVAPLTYPTAMNGWAWANSRFNWPGVEDAEQGLRVIGSARVLTSALINFDFFGLLGIKFGVDTWPFTGIPQCLFKDWKEEMNYLAYLYSGGFSVTLYPCTVEYVPAV